MEPVFRGLEISAGLLARVQGLNRRYFGLENIPRTGGAVLAVNHTGYEDFLPIGLGAYRAGRRARFLVKSELMDQMVTRFIVRGAQAVPVDRSAGANAFRDAVAALAAGEIVAVYPESTISRSFELKEFKTGAIRMAVEAGVPVIPGICWGAQRVITKAGHRRMFGKPIPVDTEFGPPMRVPAEADPDAATAELHALMTELLHRVQDRYPEAPAGAFWVPARLGGSAPTPEEAIVIEDAEAAKKAAARAAKRDRER